MVQVIETEDPRGRLSEMLGMSLGQGIGNGLNTFFANRSLESVMKDKSLKGAPQSKKLEALRSALSPYGEKGQEIFQQRMMIDQQEMNEANETKALKKEKMKGRAIGKFQKGAELSDEEWAMFTPQEVAALQKAYHPKDKTPISERPLDAQQLNAIREAHNDPNWNSMNETQKYHTLLEKGASAPNAERESKLFSQQAAREDQKVESAYKAQQDFIDDTTKAYRSFETEFKPRLLQMRNIKDEDLISPTAAVFLDALGIPLGALDDPSSELYQKLSQDLLKGLPDTYGSRILKVEVDNFLKTIPTLLNSADGRRMIASNMLKLGEMKEVYYNAMRQQQREYLDKNKPLPRDFQQTVFDQVKPQIDRINNEFVKLSEIKSVPKDTIPFFNPNGEVEFVPKEHAQWASENGGRKIW